MSALYKKGDKVLITEDESKLVTDDAERLKGQTVTIKEVQHKHADHGYGYRTDNDQVGGIWECEIEGRVVELTKREQPRETYTGGWGIE